MYISELLSALQIARVQYGDIEVVVTDQKSFQITLEVVDRIDPKTLAPVSKVITLK